MLFVLVLSLVLAQPPPPPWPACETIPALLKEGDSCSYTGPCTSLQPCCQVGLTCESGTCSSKEATTLGAGDPCSVAEPCRGGANFQCVDNICKGKFVPGDKCKSSDDCVTNSCSDDKCQPIADGGKCTSDLECSFSSFCMLGECEARAADGESCAGKSCAVGSTCSRPDMVCAAFEGTPFLNSCSSFLQCEDKDDYCSGVMSSCAMAFSTLLYKTYAHPCHYDAGKDWNGCAQPVDTCMCGPWTGERVCMSTGSEYDTSASVSTVTTTVANTLQLGYICGKQQKDLIRCGIKHECVSLLGSAYNVDMKPNSCTWKHCKVESQRAEACQCKAYKDYFGENAFTDLLHCGFVWEWWYILLIGLGIGCCVCPACLIVAYLCRRSYKKRQDPARAYLINHNQK